METSTTEIPDKKVEFLRTYKKINIKIIKSKVANAPNSLTVKTIKDAHNGKGIDKQIKNVRSFISSL